MKTGLPAKDGDDDLVAYYYLALHPMTQSGREKKMDIKKAERRQIFKRLEARFGEGMVRDFINGFKGAPAN